MQIKNKLSYFKNYEIKKGEKQNEKSSLLKNVSFLIDSREKVPHCFKSNKFLLKYLTPEPISEPTPDPALF